MILRSRVLKALAFLLSIRCKIMPKKPLTSHHRLGLVRSKIMPKKKSTSKDPFCFR